LKAQQKSLADCIQVTVHISSIIFPISIFIIITSPPTESWQQNWKQLIHYMVTWNWHWTKLSISKLINIQRSQVPHLYNMFLIPRIPIYISSFSQKWLSTLRIFGLWQCVVL